MFYKPRPKSGIHRTPGWARTPPGLVGSTDSADEDEYDYRPFDLSAEPPTPGLAQSPPWDLTAESFRRRRR